MTTGPEPVKSRFDRPWTRLAPLSRPSPSRGLALMLSATVTGSAMAAAIRHVVADLHPFEVAFFRCALGLALLTPLLVRRGLAPFRTQRLRHHAGRAVLNVAVMLCFFVALKLAPLAKVTALGFASPLFAALLATLFLGEVARPRRSVALVVGFLGMVVIVRPGLIEIDLGTVMILAYALAWGIAMTAIKSLARTESSLTLTLYMYALSLPVLLGVMLPFWRTPTLVELAWLAAIGGLGNLTALAFAQALRETELTAVLPLDYTRLLWTALLGFVFFAEVPEIWTWIGGTLIFASSTYIAVQEGRRARAAQPGAERGGP